MQAAPSSYSGPRLAPGPPGVDRVVYGEDTGELWESTGWQHVDGVPYVGCTCSLQPALRLWVNMHAGGRSRTGCSLHISARSMLAVKIAQARQRDCAMGQRKSSALATASHPLAALPGSDVGAKARLGFALIVIVGGAGGKESQGPRMGRVSGQRPA
jgi:hypothetical protein